MQSSAHYRQPHSTYQGPLLHHRQPSSSSSGSYHSPGHTTSQHSPGPNAAYGHRSNTSLGGTTDVKREYDEQPPSSRYYTNGGYDYSASGNSGYSSSAQYYPQGSHYNSAQFGPGPSGYSYNSMSRCADSPPPVSPVTSTPDYFVNQSSSSSTSSPTSPASPDNGNHYNWQTTQTNQSDGQYTSTGLPPQYDPNSNPFLPPPRTVMCSDVASPTAAARPYICEECGMSFARQHDLRRHYGAHNTPPVKKLHPCPYCGKYLSRRDAIKRHVVSKQCPVAAEKGYGWPPPEGHIPATPIPSTTTRTRGSSTNEDARLRRESITNPYPRVDPIPAREVERAEIERLERTGNEARIVVDPRSGGGYPVAYTSAGRP